MSNDNVKSVSDILAKSKSKIIGARPTEERVLEVPLERLKPNPFQPRKDMTASQTAELAKSIEQEELLQPIVIAEDPSESGSYYIIAGHRRVAAHEHLKRASIKAVVREWSEDRADVQALIENQQRENLTPFEAAEAITRIMERHGLKQVEAAERIGMSALSVNRLLKIGALPERVQHEYRAEPISYAMLFEIAQVKDHDTQLRLWDKAKQGDLTSRNQVRAIRDAKAGKTKEKPVPETTPTERVLQELSRSVQRVERIAGDEVMLNPERVGEFIELYQRFSNAVNAIAQRNEVTLNPETKTEEA